MGTELPADLNLPPGFRNPRITMPGVLVVESDERKVTSDEKNASDSSLVTLHPSLSPFPLLVLVDDSEFAARTLNNWLWVTFTRSNPAADIDGLGAFTHQKHWGCTGPLVIDARIKPHHAPPLIEDPAVTRRVDQLAARGGPLHGII